MSAHASTGAVASYVTQFFNLVWLSVAQLVRSPSHSRRAEAARRLARHALLASAIAAIAIIVLMLWFDATEIGLMPPRGTASLWPVRILTDFGKDAYVLSCLAALLVVVAFVALGMRGIRRAQWLSFGVRLQFLFFAVLTPVIAGEILKWLVGRGRPFVGGKANAFNFAPLAGTEAHASFPSSHVITAAALAFSVAALWPRARPAMIVYAILIAGSRLVLLAHHPSDVIGGAVVGVIGAMSVRYWFAARRLGFAIRRDGQVVPLRGVFGRRIADVRRPSA